MQANEQEVTKAIVQLCEALDIDPAAMMVAVAKVDIGYEVRILIVPDEAETEESESEAEIRRMVDEIF
jgi:hypothetical protein